MAGFEANAGEFASVASGIREQADPVRDKHGAKLGDLGMGEGDFGREHGENFQGFQDGMNKLAACVSSMADAMDDFAEKLEQTGSGYDWSDAESSSTVEKSGE